MELINLEKFKNTIRTSLQDFAFEYQWEEARLLYCKKDELHTYIGTATEYISELFTEQEQEKFWELPQEERDAFVSNLGEIYDEVWGECYDEYKQEEYEDEIIIQERGSLCY